MNTRHFKVETFLAYIAGSLLLIGGMSGFCSLYLASQHYEQTTAVVEQLQVKKTYHHRKLRYNHTMWISYPTHRYGKLSTSTDSYYPFRRTGDELIIWYHPEHPREIRFPKSECWFSGILLGCGLLILYIGVCSSKKTKIS